jgi:hypothetical protein
MCYILSKIDGFETAFGFKQQKKLTLDGAWKVFFITFSVALIKRGLSTDTTFDLTPFSLDDILNPFLTTLNFFLFYGLLRTIYAYRDPRLGGGGGA